MGRLQIAVGFFGITRSLKWTHESIEKNILQPLEALGDVRVYGHFFNQTEIANPRSGESGALDPGEYRLLPFDEVLLEPPGACLDQWGYPEILARGNCWKDAGQSLANLIHQLHSLKKLAEMIAPQRPDLIVLARPDLRYHDSLLAMCHAQIGHPPRSITLPDWQWFSGANDRFAVADYDGFEAYANRIDQVRHFLADTGKPLHAEQLLFYSLNRAGIRVYLSAARASRVRANGVEVDECFKPVSFKKKLRRFAVNRLACLRYRPSSRA